MERTLEWIPEDDVMVAEYQAFMTEHGAKVGPLGDWRQGEIEIVTDAGLARECVLAMQERLARLDAKTGVRTRSDQEILEFTGIGIEYEDQYALMVRFPVLFPPAKGKTEPGRGEYITWFWRALFGQTLATCGMPVMPDGKIVLQAAFRHATREWVLEFPRGGVDAGRGVLDALRRELGEEAGLTVGDIVPLGLHEPDNGLMASVIPMFMARVTAVGESHHEYAEAIGNLHFFNIAEFEKILRDQKFEHSGRTYHVRGSFENFCMNQARLRGLL